MNKPSPNTCTPVQAYAAADGSLHRTPELAAQHGMFVAVCNEMTKWYVARVASGALAFPDRWPEFVRELCHPNNTLSFQLLPKEPIHATPEEN